MTHAKMTVLVVAAVMIVSCGAQNDSNERTQTPMTEQSHTEHVELLDIPLETITGEHTSLREFAGHPMLIVNVASKCGYTPQYEGLQALYQELKDSGLVVIGFPANNFGGQEPGTNTEILEFCTSRYNVTFPMMAKVSVKGDDKHPLFKALTEDSPLSGEIEWNFSKFLLDKSGQLVARFGTKTEPTSDEVRNAISALL